eukprot:4130803-Prorocentrum_lima.AAC.1
MGGVIRTTVVSSMGAFKKVVLMSVVVMVSTRPLVRLRTIRSNPMSTLCVDCLLYTSPSPRDSTSS